MLQTNPNLKYLHDLIFLTIAALLINSLHAQPAFITNSLLAYYQLDGNGADASGYFNNTKPIGGPKYSTNRFGDLRGALDLIEKSGYLEAPHRDSLNAFPLTISCWVASVDATSSEGGLITKYNAASWNGWALIYAGKGSENADAYGNIFPWYLRNGKDVVIGRYGFPPFEAVGYGDGKWHHIAFALDEAFGRLYIDGQLKSYQPWNGQPGGCTTTQPLRIGYYSPVGGFDGLIDDVRIYNRSLSDAEIKSLFIYESKPFPAIQLAAPSPAKAIAQIINGGILGITITDGGTGYTNPPTISFEGGGGNGARAIAVLNQGSVSEIILTDPGRNYTNAPSVVFESDSSCPLNIPLPKIGNVRLSGNQILYDIYNINEFPLAFFSGLKSPLTTGCTQARSNRFEIRTVHGSSTNLSPSIYQSYCKPLAGPSDFINLNLDLQSSSNNEPKSLAVVLIDRLCGNVYQGPPYHLDWGISVVDFATNRIVVSETNGWVTLPLRRTSRGGALPSVMPLSINFLVETSAREGIDFLQPSPAVMPSFQNSGNLAFRVIDNMESDGSKIIKLSLTNMGLTNVELGANSSIIVEVTDNDVLNPVIFVLESAPSNIVAMSDGRILVAGGFQSVGGKRRPHLAQLTREMLIDTNFSVPDYYTTNAPRKAIILSDGSLVTLEGRCKLVRFERNGRLDSEFEPFSDSNSPNSLIRQIVPEGGGGILIDGFFTIEFSKQRPFRRLFLDGGYDTEFAANIAAVSKVSILGGSLGTYHDGRFLVYSGFSGSTNGRYGLTRLMPNGSLDPTLPFTGGFSNTVRSIKVDRDGKSLVAGRFKQFKTNAAPGLVRILENGSFDASFTPNVNGELASEIEVTHAGQIILFITNRLHLLSSQGLFINTIASNVTAFALQPDDQVLVGSTDFPHLWRAKSGDVQPAGVEFLEGRIRVYESARSVTLNLVRKGNISLQSKVGYRVLAPQKSLGIKAEALSGQITFKEEQSDGSIVLELDARRSSQQEDRIFMVQLVSYEGANLAPGRDVAVVEVLDEDNGLISEVFTSDADASGSYGVLESLQSQRAFFRDRRGVRRDSPIFFEWGWDSGPNGGRKDDFAIIWSGLIVPEVSGTYYFSTWADNGTRIWLNDQLIQNNWGPMISTWVPSTPVEMKAGNSYTICIHYQEGFGSAECNFAWKPPGITNWITVPRSVLRPVDVVRHMQPTLRVSQHLDQRFSFDVAGEPGRPVHLEISTNQVAWQSIAEINHSTSLVTNQTTLIPSSAKTPFGAHIRAKSIDGKSVESEYVIPLSVYLRVVGDTNLLDGSTNAVTLYAHSNGSSRQVLRWWRNDSLMTNGPVGSSLTLSGRTLGAVGKYRVTVEDQGAYAESLSISVLNLQGPIVGAPVRHTLQAGAPATLWFDVAGSEPMTFAWFKDGSPIPGGTNASLILPLVIPANEGNYSLVVTNAAGFAVSEPMVVRIVPEGTLKSSVRWSNGKFITNIPVNPGQYHWQVSLDLKSWVTVSRITISETPFTFESEVSPEENVRFYRLIPSE